MTDEIQIPTHVPLIKILFVFLPSLSLSCCCWYPPQWFTCSSFLEPESMLFYSIFPLYSNLSFHNPSLYFAHISVIVQYILSSLNAKISIHNNVVIPTPLYIHDILRLFPPLYPPSWSIENKIPFLFLYRILSIPSFIGVYNYIKHVS